MTTEEGVATEKTADEVVGRVFEATLGMMDILSIYLGDRLGLYRALRDTGPSTADDLAARAGIDRRYALEWLEQQAVTGFIDVDDVAAAADERRYTLPDAYADPFLDGDNPSIVPLARSAVAFASVAPQLLEAFRTGGGVPWADFGPDMVEAQGDFNRPWLMGSFGSEMLPAIPGIAERLAADPPARVADVACGVGWAAIAIARAYPNVRVDGFDIDASSIELANQHAHDAGVSDRVTFHVAPPLIVTTPDPTVFPPSRRANRLPSYMAIGCSSSTSSDTLSPGMHISAPTSLAVPVTSVVRK